jgi:hypothetical protein
MKTIRFKIREIFKPLIFSVMLAMISSLAIGQKIMFRDNVYYKSNKYELSAEGKKLLAHVKDSLTLDSSCTIVINGHADERGSPEYNMKLSAQRAEGVRKYLTEKGIPASYITVNAYGETQPLADNTSSEGKQKNRRVEISISTPERVEAPLITSTMKDFYGLTAAASQKFCVNPERDTLLRCEKGTLVYVKANSFNIAEPKKGACINVEIKEVFTKSEMMLENMGTASNGELMESQGILFTGATDWNGNAVELGKARTMVVMLPSDTISSVVRFDGERSGPENMMNWVADNSTLNSFNGKMLKDCWNCLQAAPPACDRCGFFFCRMGRVGKAMKGLTNKEQHLANVEFRVCQKKLRTWKKSTCAATWSQCQEITELLKKYEINKVEDLKNAVREGISQGKKLPLEQMQYYIFNVAKMGWVTPGNMSSKNNLTSVEVNLQPTVEVDCKLVLSKTHAVHPGLRTGSSFVFGNVPAGESAWVVAIRYANEKSYLSMQEVKIGEAVAGVNFKAMSISEIKKELQKLDMDIDLKSAQK